MKKFTKLVTILAILVFVIGTLAVQAAPDKVQIHPKSKKTENVFLVNQTATEIIYIAEKDLQELKSGKSILKLKFFFEPLEDKNKANITSALKMISPTEFWAVSMSVELNLEKETIKCTELQIFDETGEIIIHIGDIYIKNYEEISLKGYVDIKSIVNKANEKFN